MLPVISTKWIKFTHENEISAASPGPFDLMLLTNKKPTYIFLLHVRSHRLSQNIMKR